VECIKGLKWHYSHYGLCGNPGFRDDEHGLYTHHWSFETTNKNIKNSAIDMAVKTSNVAGKKPRDASD
jgi:hypothetical protein